MKETTTNEISNLFQELIVSKIKDELEIIKKEIEAVKESNESCENIVEKLPKSSSIKKLVEDEQTKIFDFINKNAKDSKSEKYLIDIVKFLKEQYAFSDKKTLCLILDEILQQNYLVHDELTPIKIFMDNNNIEQNLNSLTDYIKKQYDFADSDSLCKFLENYSEVTGKHISSIIAGQKSFSEKYNEITNALEKYKDSILNEIKVNAEKIRRIQYKLITSQSIMKSNSEGIATIIAKSNDEIELLNKLKNSVDNLLEKTDNGNTIINKVLEDISSESKIYCLLRNISDSINYNAEENLEEEQKEEPEENLEEKWTIKKNLLDTNKRIEELFEIIKSQEENYNLFNEKYKHSENVKNRMINILFAGNVITVLGIIVMILVQIF